MKQWVLVLSLATAAACVGAPVGDPCMPERVPQGGFVPSETYVETSSSECMTRVCLVRGLRGDPRPECASGCADELEVAEHAYCSCRCDDEGPAPGCECPEGYACVRAGRSGSYCARE